MKWREPKVPLSSILQALLNQFRKNVVYSNLSSRDMFTAIDAIASFCNTLHQGAKRSLSFTRSMLRRVKGYKLYMLVVLASFILVLLSLSVNNLPRNTPGTIQYPYEHESSSWYALHPVSSNKSLPLNTSTTGIFVEKIYDLDLSKGTFRAKGYLWSKWYGNLRLWNLEPWPVQDPLDGVYMNSTNKHDSIYDGEGYTYKSQQGGWSYTYRQFDAEFESAFDFKKYPFDDQSIHIYAHHDIDASVLRTYIDKDSVVQWNAPSFKEYSMVAQTFEDLIYEYPTRFGLTDYDPTDDQMYVTSSIKATITLHKSIQSAFIKDILPPLLVSLLLMVNTIAPDNEWEEIKAALPSAVLLSLIFLQQGYQAKIPTLNYLTFMDIYYMMLYLLTIYMAAEVVVAYKLKNNKRLLNKLHALTRTLFVALAVIGPLFVFVMI